MNTEPKDTITLRLTLDIAYCPNGVDPQTLIEHLGRVVGVVVTDAGLVGDTPAFVADSDLAIQCKKAYRHLLDYYQSSITRAAEISLYATVGNTEMALRKLVGDFVGLCDIEDQLELISNDPKVQQEVLGFDPSTGESNHG